MADTKTCLLIIDVQKGLFPTLAPEQSEEVQRNIPLLLTWARGNRVEIIHIQHLSLTPTSVLAPSSLGVGVHECAQPLPSEVTITKGTNSAFVGTKLEQILRDKGIRRLIIAGLVTEHCVSTTTRMAADLRVLRTGDEEIYDMIKRILLVGDATASQGSANHDISPETMRKVALAELDGEFCRVVSTREVLDDACSLSGREGFDLK